MIEKKNRVPLGNQKNNIIRTNLSTALSTSQLIATMNAGVFADVSNNDATSGDNVGVAEVGTKQTKAMWDEVLAASGATTGTGEAFLLAQTGFYLQDGAVIRLKLHTMPIGATTLNVASTGAHPIVTPNGRPIPAYPAGTWVTVVFSADTGNFILQGEGGDGGTRYGNGVGQISTLELCLFTNFNPHYGR